MAEPLAETLAARSALLAAIEASPWLTISRSMFGTRRYRDRTVETMSGAEARTAADNLRAGAASPVLTLPAPLEGAVHCVCGRRTLPVFIVRLESGASCCTIAFTDEDEAVPGCSPDERSADIIARRNSRRSQGVSALSLRMRYPLSARIRCMCGRTTLVGTSDLLSLRDPALSPDPPDAAFPLAARSCWLGIDAEGASIAGCCVDHRTFEILRRCGRALNDDPRMQAVTLEERPTARPVAIASAPVPAVTQAEDEPPLLFALL